MVGLRIAWILDGLASLMTAHHFPATSTVRGTLPFLSRYAPPSVFGELAISVTPRWLPDRDEAVENDPTGPANRGVTGKFLEVS